MERIPKVPNSPSNFAAYTKPVSSTEMVDPHTIRLHTNGVFPLLPTYLAQFFIINRKSDEGLATEDFNSGKAAIGTGPFRFVSFKPGDRVELERNDSYWGPKPVWQHDRPTASSRTMPRAPRRCSPAMWISSTSCPPRTWRSCARIPR